MSFTTGFMKTCLEYFKPLACLRVSARKQIWCARRCRRAPVKYVAAIVLLILCGNNLHAAISDGSPADLVLGQPDAISNYPNVVTGSTFNQPYAVAENGAVYVVDYQNNRVLKWSNAAGLGNGQAADGVIGQEGFTQGKANRGGSPASNTLNKPCGIALWSTAVWVADCGNNRVLRFPNPPSFGASADIVLGQPNATSNSANGGGSVGQNTLNYPTDVAINPDNSDVWVADAGNSRVLKFTFAQLATGMNANLVVGQPDFISNTYFDGQAYFGGQTGPGSQLGIDMSSYYSTGDLWVADYVNHRVLKFNAPASNGPNASLVIGQADFSAKECNRGAGMYGNNASSMTLCYPLDVSVNSANGRVTVSDYKNSRVLRYDSPATNVGADLVLGQTNFASNNPDQGVSRSSTSLSMQRGINAYSTDFWVADTVNDRVLKFPSPGANGSAASLVLGQSTFTKANVNSIEERGLYYPYGVAIDKKWGRVFVADSSNNRVLWWNTIQALATGRPADGVLGQSDFSGGTVLLPPTANSLRDPYSAAVDKDGNLWVADEGNSRVLRYNGATLATGGAADLVLGQADFNSYLNNRGGSTAANTMQYPAGVVVDESGNVWVSDSGNNRILKFTAALLANGVNASLVLGQTSFTGNLSNRGGTVAANTLNAPYGIYSESTNIWVADANNNRVLKYAAPSADGANAMQVLGQTVFNQDLGGTAQQNKLRDPRGVNVDGMGNVWVSEYNTNRVVKFIPPLSDGMQASLVLGQADFVSGAANRGGNVSTNTLQHPYGVATDNVLNVYVADADNHRITIYYSGLSATALNPMFTVRTSTSLTALWASIPGANYVVVLSSNSSYSSVTSSTTIGVNTKSFPGLDPATTYYFEVKLSTETDIAYSLNRISTTTLARSDLVVQNFIVNPSSGAPGAGITVTFRIYNQGAGTANASTTRIRYSEDSVLTVSDPLLSEFATAEIAAGSYIDVSKALNIPASGVTAGSRYVGVTLDVNSVANQSDESNDQALTGFTVFDVTGPTGTPSTPDAGALYSTTGDITFNWGIGTAADPESGIAGYYLQIGTNTAASDAGYFDAETGTGTVKTLTGLAEGKTYYARVKAKNGAGLYGSYTAWSAGITVDLTPPTPNPPVAGGHQVYLSSITWNAGAPADSISGLHAQPYSFDNGATWQAGASSATAGLQPDMLYGKTLKYRDAAGNITSGQAVSTYTLAAVPASVAFSNLATTGFTVGWDQNGNPGGTTYSAEISKFSNFSPILAASVTANTQADFSGLEVSVRYYARVKAVNHNGLSTAYAAAAAPKYTLANPPSGTQLTAVSSGTVTLAWTGNGNSSSTVYRIARSLDDSSYNVLTATYSSPAVIAALGPETTNYFKVAAENGDGAVTGYATAVSTFVPDYTAPTGAPSTPADEGIFISSMALTFNWTIGSSADPETGITGYYLEAGTNTATNNKSAFDGDVGTALVKQLTGLEEGKTYFARLKAKNGRGLYGSYSAWSDGITVDTTPPAAPTITSQSHPDPAVIYFSTAARFVLSGADPVSGMAGFYYRIDQASNTVPGVNDAYLAGSSTQITAGLAAGTWYFHAVAKDAAGNIGLAGQTRHYEINIGSAINPVRDNTFDFGSGGDKVVVSIPSGTISGAASMVIETKSAAAVPPAPRDPTTKDIGVYREIGLSSGTIQAGKTVTISIAYEPWQVAGLDEDSLRLAHFNPAGARWEIIYDSVVDKAGRRVTATVNHFSLFKIVAYTAQAGALASVGNYPNPFTAGRGGQTRIHYSLKTDSGVEIRIYDLLGALVWHKSVQPGETGGSLGVNDVPWDGKNDKGIYVGAGAYICIVKAGGETGKVKIAVK